MNEPATTSEPAPSWVTLGTVGAGGRAILDRRGTLALEGDGWSIDWWAGAEDRWHTCRDAAVIRQAPVESTPVVVSGMRLPGGELEQLVWAVASAGSGTGGGLVVMEYHNATSVPIALALAIRPSTVDGAISSINIKDRTVYVNGVPSFVLSKDPSRVAIGTAVSADPYEEITSGGGVSSWPVGGVTCSAKKASAVLVFPLPHTATNRFAVALAAPQFDEALWSTPDLSAIPPSDRVVAGWVAQTTRAPRFDVPERLLEQAVTLSQRHLLMHAAGEDPLRWPGVPVDGVTRAELCMALDEQGFHLESERVLRAAIDLQRTDGSFDDGRLDGTAGWVVALGTHCALRGDITLASEASARIGAAVHWLRRRQEGRWFVPRSRFFGAGTGPEELGHDERAAYDARWTLRAYRAAAMTLVVVDQPEAAGNVETYARILETEMIFRSVSIDGAGSCVSGSHNIQSVRKFLSKGSPLWTWGSAVDGHDPLRTARFLRDVHALLIDDDGNGSLGLLPVVPEEWFGQPIAVHDLPTSGGRLSYAIRWHGTRPALLWDLEPLPRVGAVLRAPGLDSSWATSTPKGETLLAEPIGRDFVPEHHEPLDEGTSFS